ncbi:hypothetical protein C8Q79DRAFT_941556 [Trametes meyenii]|nr:hypothetical protein C8Q79DRAFT_941556 [Trametes meyenii]
MRLTTSCPPSSATDAAPARHTVGSAGPGIPQLSPKTHPGAGTSLGPGIGRCLHSIGLKLGPLPYHVDDLNSPFPHKITPPQPMHQLTRGPVTGVGFTAHHATGRKPGPNKYASQYLPSPSALQGNELINSHQRFKKKAKSVVAAQL